MAHHFYLPQLSGENISVPKESGHWNNNDRKIILGIGDAIAIDEQAVTRGVSSIPDIWARPLLFQAAIKPASQHPLKKRCIQEWRGLLSLLALHKIKPELADLEIVSVQLDDERFSTALRNLVPTPIQLEKDVRYQWTDVLMIRFKGVPVGAFSPTTLVYTAVDYNKKLADLPFAFKDKEGYLAPPQTREDGLEYLGEWLYVLQQKLTPVFYTTDANPDRQVVGNINQLLDAWLKEIRQKLGVKENEPINVRTHKIADDPMEVKGIHPFLRDYRVYEQLLYPLKKDDSLGGDALISDLLLRSTRHREKRIVVITDKGLSTQVNIWNERRPRSLGENAKTIIETFFNTSHGSRIDGDDIGKDGGLWIRPEMYFLSDTLLTARDGALLEEEEGSLNVKTKFILPFKKEILDFFAPEEIREKLMPAYTQDGNMVKFSFTLPVGDGSYKIEKTYKTKVTQKDEGEITEIDAPIVEIFPNYLGESWRKYFLFHGNAESYTVTPLTKSENKKFPSRDRDFRGETNQRIRVYDISGDDCFPEAVEVATESGKPLGVVLIERHERQSQGLKHQWTVGVDFGTSNTNVYKNSASIDAAERWAYNFPSYYRHITANHSAEKTKILEEFFFPTRKVQLPIPTTLKMYNLAKKEAMVLDYFIYYPVAYKFPDNVLTDIKWDGLGERNTEYFLESLLFLLLIEVVKNGVAEVDLACSYPKAFSTTNIVVFQQEWRKVYEKLLRSEQEKILDIHGGSPADNELKVIIREPVFETEGIAAGAYFASAETIPDIRERANKEIAAICMDVGGGTTDISIWYLDKIEFDASVLLAGRQLSNLLQTNGRVRELLFSKDAAIALEEKKGAAGYFSARLNLILKNEEEQIKNMLVKHANNKDVQWLRQIIALEFGALAFYTATVCISTNDKVGGLLTRIAEDGINLHWGGNAAKLINWIDFGNYNKQGIASKILNATFFKCLDDVALAERAVKAKALMQLQSPGHKSEASGGLVVMALPKNGTLANEESSENEETVLGEEDMDKVGNDTKSYYAGIVCGDNIELTHKSVSFHTPITHKDLFDTNNQTLFKSTSLERLERFVSILNFYGIKNGLFTEDTKIILGESEKRLIRDSVKAHFISMQKLRESERLIEPVFILEIKVLLDIIKSKMR